ncbi:molybdopterin converting factor small subunit [Desulfitispora alkaliphila]|uniref:MoaD/ThiS family protein n=1 Tax=Desulfitispora alkaliphila TaxID=622674 RepID=UPI003D258415
MAVEVRLFATLRDYYPPDTVDGVYKYNPQGEETVRELAERLELPFVQIHLIMINGIQGNLDHKIKDGDRIGFFPPVGGG